jgi:AcrR family transcriptional regulator
VAWASSSLDLGLYFTKVSSRGLGGRALAEEDRRERLLDAAEASFCAHGYEGTTIGVLAAEAGVTRPTVYAYFASKDDVFRALAERVRQEFLELQEHVDTSSPERTVREAMAAYLAAWARHRGMLTVIGHQALGDPAVRALRDDIVARAERRNTRFLERLVAQGRADPAVPPPELSRAVTGIVARAADVAADEPGRYDQLAAWVGDAYLRLAGIA